MGTPALTRRDFLRSLSIKKEKPVTGDPLFEKYSRKTLGPRVYSNELVSFASGAGQGPGEETSRIGNITSGLTAYAGTWDINQALHLLRRTGFGFTKSEADTIVAAGSASAAVDIILNIDNTVPAPPVNWYNNIFADENGLAYGADWTNDAFISNTVGKTSNIYRQAGLQSWMMQLALNKDISIREKMAMFWFHFLPIDLETIFKSVNPYIQTNSSRISYQYLKMFRDNATGNFKSLIRNLATQPAMMYYLNNQANTNTAPDENFARELMELFTLGKDPLSLYTQDDVVAAAQVLTGWRVQNLNTAATTTIFDSTKHSTTSKQFSSFFNNTVINNTGASELDTYIDMIFSKQQVVSEYICRRLYRFFIYYDIDANIETNVITPLAQTFVAANWNILPVLQQLFKSEHFYDVANKGVYIKAPMDLVVGSLRHFNLSYNVSDPTNYQAQTQLLELFQNNYCLLMDQQFGQVPNVSGWVAFYQTPAFHEYWINSGTIQSRFAFLQDVFNGINKTYNGLLTKVKVDPIAYAQQFANATIQDPNLLVAECIKYLLPITLSSDEQASIKFQTLLSQQTNDTYWTTAWNNYTANPGNNSYKTIVSDRLKSLLYTLVQLAEYELM